MPIHRRHAIPEPRRTTYRYVFLAAAIYNAVWGVAMLVAPRFFLRLGGLSAMQVGDAGVVFWQCIGMFVMVFGICYWYCWREPERYAPFILVGLLGKVFGPIGFLWAWLFLDVLPLRAGLNCLTNDLIWWPAFVPFVFETTIQRRYEPR